MDKQTIAEESYKNGYDRGYSDGLGNCSKSRRPADSWLGVVCFKPLFGTAGHKVLKYVHVQCSAKSILNSRNSKFCPDCGTPMCDPNQYIDEEEWLNKYVRKESKADQGAGKRSAKVSTAQPG